MDGAIARWTTPSISYKPLAVTADRIVIIELRIRQAGQDIISKGLSDAAIIDGGFVWDFDQEESGLIARTPPVYAQIDYVADNGRRFTTRPYEFAVFNSAVDGVIT